jgi:hypothetical protein
VNEKTKKKNWSWSCVVRNTVLKGTRKKFHLPDNENAGLSQAKHLQLLYENQRVNVVFGNKRCLS